MVTSSTLLVTMVAKNEKSKGDSPFTKSIGLKSRSFTDCAAKDGTSRPMNSKRISTFNKRRSHVVDGWRNARVSRPSTATENKGKKEGNIIFLNKSTCSKEKTKSMSKELEIDAVSNNNNSDIPPNSLSKEESKNSENNELCNEGIMCSDFFSMHNKGNKGKNDGATIEYDKENSITQKFYQGCWCARSFIMKKVEENKLFVTKDSKEKHDDETIETTSVHTNETYSGEKAVKDLLNTADTATLCVGEKVHHVVTHCIDIDMKGNSQDSSLMSSL